MRLIYLGWLNNNSNLRDRKQKLGIVQIAGMKAIAEDFARSAEVRNLFQMNGLAVAAQSIKVNSAVSAVSLSLFQMNGHAVAARLIKVDSARNAESREVK